MIINKVNLGSFNTNCYLLTDKKTRETIIIDPADEGEFIAEKLLMLETDPRIIFLTHGHSDHVMAAWSLQLIYKIPVFMSGRDMFLIEKVRNLKNIPDAAIIRAFHPEIIPVNGEASFAVGNLHFLVLETPGHTPGSCALYFPDHRAIFTGDTLFEGGAIGRSDFPYSESEKLNYSVQRLLSLPGITRIYPGHGNESLIETERLLHQQQY